jgi:hypothetical protein
LGVGGLEPIERAYPLTPPLSNERAFTPVFDGLWEREQTEYAAPA